MSSFNPARLRVLVTTVPFGEATSGPLDARRGTGAEVVINPIGRRLKEAELVELARGFHVLVAGTEPITARVMDNAPELRLIARVGIGLDNVDLAAASARGIEVTYTPDAPSPAVAELAIGLMLSLLRGIPSADRTLRAGTWHRVMGRRLSEQTVGILGVGRIGRRVIRHLRGGFPGVRILANDIAPDLEFGAAHDVVWAGKDAIYRTADIISLHLPLTPQTRRLITGADLALMRPTTLLVNTARGNMIDERDLAVALRDGTIAGAAIDVFGHEPYAGELTTLDNCLLTCHMGSMSRDCRAQMEAEAVEEVVRFLRGEPLLRAVPQEAYL